MEDNAQKLGDLVAWDGKKLVITADGVVETKLRRKALSASTSKSMQGCAAQWAAGKLLGAPMGPFEAAPLGTAAHAVMEDLMGLEPSARTIARAEELTRVRAETMWPDLPSESDSVRQAVTQNRQKWIEEVFACWLGLFTIENPSDVNVYAREMSIEGVVLNGVPTIGYIDRVEYGDFDGTPGLIPVDYKSGKVPKPQYQGDHKEQIIVYSAAIEFKTGIRPPGGRIYYTKHGVSVPVDTSQKAVDKTLATFRSSWNKHNKYMKEAAFPTKTGPLCGWCDLVNSCPAAAAAGKGPRKEGLPTAVQLGIPTVGVPPVPPVPPTLPPAPEEAAQTPENGSLDEALAVSAETFAAHIPCGSDYHQNREEEAFMSQIIEAKPWEPTTDHGDLNPNSFAAGALFGLSSLAVSELNKAGVPLGMKNVSALSHTFKHLVCVAQAKWTGSTNLQHGANTRLRGALYTVLETLPVPFGQDKGGWDDWANQVVRRLGAVVAVSLEMWDTEYPEGGPMPWEALAGVAPAAKPALSIVPAEAAPAAEPEAPKPAKTAPKRAPRASRAKAAAAAPAPAAESAPAPVVEPAPVAAPVPVQAAAPAPVAAPAPAPAAAPEPEPVYADDVVDFFPDEYFASGY